VAEDSVDDGVSGRVCVRQRHDEDEVGPVGAERSRRDEIIEERNLYRSVTDDVNTDAGDQHLNDSLTTADHIADLRRLPTSGIYLQYRK